MMPVLYHGNDCINDEGLSCPTTTHDRCSHSLVFWVIIEELYDSRNSFVDYLTLLGKFVNTVVFAIFLTWNNNIAFYSDLFGCYTVILLTNVIYPLVSVDRHLAYFVKHRDHPINISSDVHRFATKKTFVSLVICEVTQMMKVYVLLLLSFEHQFLRML